MRMQLPPDQGHQILAGHCMAGFRSTWVQKLQIAGKVNALTDSMWLALIVGMTLCLATATHRASRPVRDVVAIVCMLILFTGASFPMRGLGSEGRLRQWVRPDW